VKKPSAAMKEISSSFDQKDPNDYTFFSASNKVHSKVQGAFPKNISHTIDGREQGRIVRNKLNASKQTCPVEDPHSLGKEFVLFSDSSKHKKSETTKFKLRKDSSTMARLKSAVGRKGSIVNDLASGLTSNRGGGHRKVLMFRNSLNGAVEKGKKQQQ